jgi:hypothetical protein
MRGQSGDMYLLATRDVKIPTDDSITNTTQNIVFNMTCAHFEELVKKNRIVRLQRRLSRYELSRTHQNRNFWVETASN